MTESSATLHLAVLGCGFMGTAMIQGFLAKASSDDKYHLQYTALVRSDSSATRLREALGKDAEKVGTVIGEDNFVSAVEKSDVIILGFPPDQLTAAFRTEGLSGAVSGKLIISLLAGVSYSQLRDVVSAGSKGSEQAIVRAIPSIGAKINASMTLLAESSSTSSEQNQTVDWLFSQLGSTQWLPESLMNEATALGAVCHALAVVAVDSATDGSVAQGIPRAAALKLAAACLSSAAGMMVDGVGNMTPESLKEAMSVPKGITVNAVLDLQREGVGNGVGDAVVKAIKYTRSMAE